MRSDQRKRIVQKFFSEQLVILPTKSLQPAGQKGATSSNDVLVSSECLSVTAEESGISTIAMVTLRGIWSKATALLQGENLITPAPDKRACAVISYRSTAPHIVSCKKDNQFVCDSNCPQWVSSKICSHIVAVAQVNHSLKQFLDWYVSFGLQPNITTLAMAGMPSGRGKKKNQITKSRSRASKKTSTASPDTIVFAPRTLSVSETHTPTRSLPTAAVPVISNPFYVKFITGNIRMCQGCRTTLRTKEGLTPPPPHDLTIARAERRPYRNASGTLVTPTRETASHYHCREECVKAADPGFVSVSLRVPVDIYNQLNAIHREYLNGQFGLSV